MAEICVLGSLNADLAVQVDRLPGAGETVLGTSSLLTPGGKGANQAAAASSLGAQAFMVGCVGADELGDLMCQDLAARGVDISRVRRVPGLRSGSATIPVAPDGANLIVVDSGANSAVSASDAECAPVRESAVVLLQLEVPMPAVMAAARAASGTVVLNPAPYRPLTGIDWETVDILVPNHVEFGGLTGCRSPRSLDEAISMVAAVDLPTSTVVTLGEHGALVRLHMSSEVVHVPAPVVEVVDTTGAGDCLCAALGVALTGGAELVEAVRFAVAAASVSITGAGARGRLPTPADLSARGF